MTHAAHCRNHTHIVHCFNSWTTANVPNMITQGTRLSLANRTTNLCKCNGVADSAPHTTPNLVVLQKNVVRDRGKPQKWGALGLRPFGTGLWLSP